MRLLSIVIILIISAAVRADNFAPAPPDRLELEIEVDLPNPHPQGSLQARSFPKGKRRIQLHRYTIRALDYRIRVWNGEELVEMAEVPPSRTYRGFTIDNPNEQISAVLYPNGDLKASATSGQRWVWKAQYRVNVADQLPDEIGTDDGRHRWGGGVINRDPGELPFPVFPPNRPLQRMQLAADITRRCIDHNQVGSVENAIAWTEWQALEMDQSYVRHLALSCEITEVIIRETEYYPHSEGLGSGRLKEFWTTYCNGDNWDYVNGFLGPSGGMSGLGTPFSMGPVQHEVGHSFAMTHEVYGTDMQNPVNHAVALTHFSENGLFKEFTDVPTSENPDPIHPATTPDIVVTEPGVPVRMNVLANDWDSHGEKIHIRSHTTRTKAGGEVRKIIHRCEDGTEMDALGYIPAEGYVGKDVVLYVVENESGLHTAEVVHIYVIDERAEWAGHFAFDMERDGFTPDRGSCRVHLSLPAGASITDAGFENAVRLAPGTELLVGDRDLLPDRPSESSPTRGLSSQLRWYPLEEEVGNDFDPLDRDYTLAFWFRAPAFSEENQQTGQPGEEVTVRIGGVLVDKANADIGDTVGFRLRIVDDHPLLYVREFGATRKRQEITHQDPVRWNEWQHVAIRFDRKRNHAELFLNGARSSDLIELSPGSYIFAGRSDLRFRASRQNEVEFDEIRIAYRALSNRDITSLTGMSMR